ncbi:hypothetical protein Tco_1564926 [Tanacetum coccineum]
MAARMASVVDGVGDGGGMMRRWCGCGDEVRGGCDDGDDDESGGGGETRVEARGSADRVDRLMRSIFGFGRKTRRKSFPAAAGGGRRWVVAG